MNKPSDLKLATVPAWINGKPVVPAGRMGDVYNPATGKVAKQVPYCDAAGIDAAVRAATAALPEWRDASILRRARVMQKFLQLMQQNQKQIAALITEEHGKTLPDAMGSVQRGIEVVEFACGIPQLLKGEYSENVGTAVDTHTVRQPVGVCAGITPFNFPAMVPLWMFPMAIACGNTFILKPSERDPSASMLLAELWAEAGLSENSVARALVTVDNVEDALGTPPPGKQLGVRIDADGSFSDGLSTNVLPQASAGAHIHIGTIAGKLNGVMPATAPSGWRIE